MYLYIHTYYYLKKAEESKCFSGKVDLNYMQLFQIIEIIAVSLTVLLPFSFKKRDINLLFLMVAFVLLINAYMAINVYQFYKELKSCPIMNSWNKWWLYWEGIAATISSVRGGLTLLLVVSIILKKWK